MHVSFSPGCWLGEESRSCSRMRSFAYMDSAQRDDALGKTFILMHSNGYKSHNMCLRNTQARLLTSLVLSSSAHTSSMKSSTALGTPDLTATMISRTPVRAFGPGLTLITMGFTAQNSFFAAEGGSIHSPLEPFAGMGEPSFGTTEIFLHAHVGESRKNM